MKFRDPEKLYKCYSINNTFMFIVGDLYSITYGRRSIDTYTVIGTFRGRHSHRPMVNVHDDIFEEHYSTHFIDADDITDEQLFLLKMTGKLP